MFGLIPLNKFEEGLLVIPVGVNGDAAIGSEMNEKFPDQRVRGDGWNWFGGWHLYALGEPEFAGGQGGEELDGFGGDGGSLG